MNAGPASLTVGAALAAARTAGLDRHDAHALLAAVLQRPRTWLIGHDEAAIDADAASRYRALLARRAAGEPLAYLLGEKEFFGLMLTVTPDVLVPRPDTETLVEWALALIPPGQPICVADLGTGSGAIALAMASQRPDTRVTAVDASPAALAVAAANGQRLGLTVEWLHSDWFGALTDRRFDLIVSNPPYIAEGDAHLAALTHEPQQALTSGPAGLDAIRLIASGASAHLAPGGWLLFEHGYDQSEAVRAVLGGAGFRDIVGRQDLAGQDRCSGGRWAG